MDTVLEPSVQGYKERLAAASSALIYPGATYRPIASHGGPMTAQDGLCLHVTTNHADPYGFFSNPANGASSTWWIGETVVGMCHCAKPQPVVACEQYYDALMKCWAQVNGNGLYQAAETSGVPTVALTAAQVHTLAHLYAWGHRTGVLNWALTLADTPGARGFIWHGAGGAAWGGHYGCPGTLRRNQRALILQQAAQILSPPTPTPTPTHPTPTHDTAPRFLGNLTIGSRGLPVHEWQQQMYHRGWHTVPGTTKTFTIDGIYGNDCHAVALAFERLIAKHGWKFIDPTGHTYAVTVDGNVDTVTWHAAWDAGNLT